MCGIVGALFSNLDEALPMEAALKMLAHRGPDDQGIWSDRHIHLGHTRLSILDLSSSGHQPMADSTGRFLITFNGEIYNYLELRQELTSLGHQFFSGTDTEVLLAAYVQWGQDCLKNCRGMFVFAIWDRQTETLFLARDRMGEKPLYYWSDRDRFYFASELKALLRLLPQVPDLDPVAVDWYMHYQYVPEPHTPLKNIWKLPAAHTLTIHRPTWKTELQRYWSLEQVPPISGCPATLIREELERSITLTLRSDVPVGLALSGGIDSGALAALAAPRYKETLQTFSIGYPGRPAYDERDQAEALAKSLGLPFYDIELTTEEFVDSFPALVYMADDPIADIAAYAHYSVMKRAAEKQVKVMLTGIGGDEVFWGYAWTARAARLTQQKQKILHNTSLPPSVWQVLGALTHQPFYRRAAANKKLPAFLSKPLAKGSYIASLDLQHASEAVYQTLIPDFHEAILHRSKLYTEDFFADLSERNPYRPFNFDLASCENIPIRICQVLFDTWLVSNCLSLGDRVSMASGVEVRLPLLDFKLVELMMGLRKAEPDHHLGPKHWLKAALQGTLPEDVLDRPKQGFQPPVGEWMDAVLHRYITHLEDGYLLQLNVLNPDYLKALIQAFRDRCSHRFILYKLLLLEIWYRTIVLGGCLRR